MLVYCEPPTSIKGHSIAYAFTAYKQSFKAHLGGFGIDFVEVLEQRDGIEIFGNELDLWGNLAWIEIRFFTPT